MSIDFGKTAADYAAHRPEFDAKLFTRLKLLGIGLKNQRILDVGAGTGLLGRGLIAAGCNVVECDNNFELLKQATGQRVIGRAERLPFAKASFDVVTSGQCWHWFDRKTAPIEIARILKPAGQIAIIYQTYIPIEGNIAATSEAVILRYRPGWRHAGGVGINGQALKDLQTARFTEIESFSFDVEISYTPKSWQGFIRTCSAVGPSLSPSELSSFDNDHAQAIAQWGNAFTVPHRVFAAVATRP